MAASSKAPKVGPGIKIRKLATSDVRAVQAILQESPEAAAWSEESLLRLAAVEAAAWVAEVTGAGCTCSPSRIGVVAGFLMGRIAGDEFEILNMAVSPGNRRQGIGSRLLECALEFSPIAGCARVYLEVRASNESALALYKRHGFTECGRRAGYYRDPVEDALLLSLSLPGMP